MGCEEMNLIRLTIVNIKRTLKDPVKLGVTFLMPLAIIIFVKFMNSTDPMTSSLTSNVTVAYNIEDEGDLWEGIYGSASKAQWIFINEKQKALDLLEGNEVAVVYNIPKGFSKKISNYEKPIIESYKREEGNVTIPMEIEINNKINEFIKEKLLVDKKIISHKDDLYQYKTETRFERKQRIADNDLNVTTLLLVYFTILGASSIVSELMDLRKKNIISRAITTPNSNRVILGSIALSLLFIQVAANSLVIIFDSIIFKYSLINFPIIFVNFILASLFSITLSLAITRIFKQEGPASLITAMIAVITLMLSIFAQDDVYHNVPVFIKHLGKFTPQYWIFDSLEKMVLFPNIFIVFLMILALFTAGSYKLKDFIK